MVCFPGGPDKAIEDEYIVALNDVIDQYAPNLKAYLDSNPEIEKMVKTYNGNFYVFPFIRSEDKLRVFFGPIVRKDWLDDLGLEIPETIEEWEVALKGFRDKKGAEAPFACRLFQLNLSSIFMGAYGIKSGFYQEDGKVKYGFIEPGYKEYLTLLNRWYKEGLIDKNFATMDQKAYEANILNGRTGFTLGYLGSGIGVWTKTKADDPTFQLVGTKYPVLNKGETPMVGQKSLTYEFAGSAAITTSCENVEVAARVLDYGYSEEGMRLYNFGIEGESYTMEDGKPVYTDLILNNSEGLSIGHAMSKYIRASYSGPMIQSGSYADQYYQIEEQLQAIKAWQDTNTDQYILPTITPTPEESSEMASIMNDIGTYQEEMMLKFIMGVESLDKFDEYIQEIKRMGIDRAIEINQSALNRYKNR
ncbi:MAG: extracellular solute-binding protein [Epulopiscium sp.]|nr:extracellular solute-binding protein [Candidatus Epulonipiscium sp.]